MVGKVKIEEAWEYEMSERVREVEERVGEVEESVYEGEVAESVYEGEEVDSEGEVEVEGEGEIEWPPRRREGESGSAFSARRVAEISRDPNAEMFRLSMQAPEQAYLTYSMYAHSPENYSELFGPRLHDVVRGNYRNLINVGESVAVTQERLRHDLRNVLNWLEKAELVIKQPVPPPDGVEYDAALAKEGERERLARLKELRGRVREQYNKCKSVKHVKAAREQVARSP